MGKVKELETELALPTAKYLVVPVAEEASAPSICQARQNLAALRERVCVFLANGLSILEKNTVPHHDAPSLNPMVTETGPEKERSSHSIIDLLDSPEDPDTSGLAVPQ